MARRKQQILQEVLSNQEEWDNFMTKGGLSVIDCHQGWCGPCKPVQGLLRRVKTELGSELLSFATADCDSIDSLEFYRDNCEPCFQFYSGGQLAGIIRGCNAPLLESMIREKTELETKILAGEIERTVFVDPMLEDASNVATEEQDGVAINDHQVSKLVTVALIKPDLTANEEKIEEILRKIEDNGLEIVADEEKVLSVDEVKELYAHKAETENFNDLVEFMTSGPVRALGLTKGDTGDGVIELWRSIIGPFDPEEAKKESSDSIRARYGSSVISNAVHGSSTADDAAKELAFFFPTFTPPKAIVPISVRAQMADDDEESVFPEKNQIEIERTITIIRPEALKAHKQSIINEISDAGFQIVREKEIQLTREQAEQLYLSQEGQAHYEALIDHMTSGPSLILCLARDNAVEIWRERIGPKENADSEAPESIRGKYSIGDFNAIHASTSGDVELEEKLFFSEETIAVIKPDAIEHVPNIVSQLESCGFTIKETRDVELSGEIASKIYAGKAGEPFFDDLVNHMTSGTCKVLVLSDIDAVEKLRTHVGPADPSQAQAEMPDSIRAKFASSLIQNAIHAPSNSEDKELTYQLLFN